MTRITPYMAGGSIAERVDEIAIGDMHMEMLDEDSACLVIDGRRFMIEAETGGPGKGGKRRARLVVRFLEADACGKTSRESIG